MLEKPGSNSEVTNPPEIVATEGIDQKPTRLSDLRETVVLLDSGHPGADLSLHLSETTELARDL